VSSGLAWAPGEIKKSMDLQSDCKAGLGFIVCLLSSLEKQYVPLHTELNSCFKACLCCIWILYLKHIKKAFVSYLKP
jgi:hypothetical protein